jgi:phosphomannomutase
MHPRDSFKAYDIRGRTDLDEITPDLFQKVGAAFVELTSAKVVAVGRDCRETSPGLFSGLAGGITSRGADVVDLGEVPTDLVYFFSGSQNVPGAMITASHNPPSYNGLKLCRSGAAPVGIETGLADIRDSVFEEDSRPPTIPGHMRVVDATGDYVDHLFSIIDSNSISAHRVAVDGGNGMAGVVLEKVFARLSAQLDGLFIEPDGTFPNHPADPIQPENLQDLIELVATGGHDLGVAFDGDADRAFFIDDEASPLTGSTVTALISRWMLRRNPGSRIVHNLIVSRSVGEIVDEAGGTPIRTKVGHSFIKQVMADTGAIFGGEHSGHYYFRDNFRADSGMLAMLVLLQVISEDGRPLSQIRADVERYRSSGEVNFRVSDVTSATVAVEKAFPGRAIDYLDGLTVDLGESWFNLRPSNTEPLLRLNVEASSIEDVQRIVDRVRSILEV